MRLFVCSVYDKAVASYLPPLCFRARGEALRSFVDATKNNEVFRSHPSDYLFYRLGFFDDATGIFENDPELLIDGVTASQVV